MQENNLIKHLDSIISKRKYLEEFIQLNKIENYYTEFESSKDFSNLLRDYNKSLLIHFGNINDLNELLENQNNMNKKKLELMLNTNSLIEPMYINKNVYSDSSLIYSFYNILKNTPTNFVGLVNVKPLYEENIEMGFTTDSKTLFYGSPILYNK